MSKFSVNKSIDSDKDIFCSEIKNNDSDSSSNSKTGSTKKDTSRKNSDYLNSKDSMEKDIEILNDIDLEDLKNVNIIDADAEIDMENEEEDKFEEKIKNQELEIQEVQKKFSHNIEKLKTRRFQSHTVLKFGSLKLDDDVTKIEEEIRFDEVNSEFVLDPSEKFYVKKNKLEENNLHVFGRFNTDKLVTTKKHDTESSPKKNVKFSVKKIIFEYPEGNELPDIMPKESKKKNSKSKGKKNKKNYQEEDDLTESEMKKLEEIRQKREEQRLSKLAEQEEKQKTKETKEIKVNDNKSVGSKSSKGKKGKKK